MSLSSTMQSPKNDFFFLVAGASLLSLSSVFVKVASVGPSVAGFYRMLAGGFILLLWCWFKREKLWKGWPYLRLAALCGLLFSLDLTLWHRSIDFVGPGLATILGNCQVFFLAFFAMLLFREKISWKIWLALPFAMLGILMIAWGDWSAQGGNYKNGIWLGLGSAIFYALYVLALQKSQSIEAPLSPIAHITWVSIIAMIFMGGEGLWQGQSFEIPNMNVGGALLGYGIIGQVLGWVWVTRGLRSTPASVAGLVLLLQPTLAFSWDILLFDRPTDYLDFVGASIVLVAIYLGTRN